MQILSIDTTADICSVALLAGERSSAFHEVRPREHAKILLPTIETLLNAAHTETASLNYVVYGRGPGSFTGIRIAAGVAQGLAVAAKCPVIPVSTLQSVAYSAALQGAEDIWVALDARMSEVYFARYRVDAAGIPALIGEEQVLPPGHITGQPGADAVLVGNGWQAGYDLPIALTESLGELSKQILLPEAAHSLALAQKLLLADPAVAVSPEQALPVYLRDNVTWDNKPKVGS